jgi:hypothetical protein
MQRRSERQKILWAIFLSLLLHLVVGVCIASFGDKLQPRLPEEEKPMELTIVDIAPAASPIIQQKNMPFIDTPDAKATTEQPKEQAFESNANSIGASELPALGIAPIPTQQGKELPTHDLESHPYSLDQQGAQPQLNSRPVPVPSAVAQATPQPGATESPADHSLNTPANSNTHGRPGGNVSRYAAAYNADSGAKGQSQRRFPGDNASATLCSIHSLSSRANTRTNGREHFQARSLVRQRRRHTTRPLREERIYCDWSPLVQTL